MSLIKEEILKDLNSLGEINQRKVGEIIVSSGIKQGYGGSLLLFVLCVCVCVCVFTYIVVVYTRVDLSSYSYLSNFSFS